MVMESSTGMRNVMDESGVMSIVFIFSHEDRVIILLKCPL